MKKKIYPNKVLQEETQRVEEFDESLKELAEQMYGKMIEWHGAGLAANQVGQNIRMATFRVEGLDEWVMINPVLLETKEETKMMEGCLSVPGNNDYVDRFNEVRVGYQDLEGNAKVATCYGVAAQCVQHEIDHLNGITYIDHFGDFKKKRALKKMKNFIRKFGKDS